MLLFCVAFLFAHISSERVGSIMYDVVIIGAGVVGAFIARELSRYSLKTCVIEKEPDVAMGSSRANSAIVHAGFDAVPGTLKAELNVLGNKLMEQAAHELGVPFKRIGSLVLCFDEKDIPRLHDLKIKGEMNGLKDLEILSGKQVRQLERNVSGEVVAALLAPSAGIVCPYELTLSALENAVDNGAEIKLYCRVEDISFENGIFSLKTTKGEMKSRFIVNAAGLFSDTIANMLGDNSFSIQPRKGEYILYDKKLGNLVERVIFQLPTEKGKGVLVTPTVDGNLLAGPTAEDVKDKEDVTTTASGQDEILKKARLSVPMLDKRGIIHSFAGLRASPSGHDFIIRPSEINPGLIHAAGIESPGLTAAPAIGLKLVEVLKASGLELKEKDGFNPINRHIEKFNGLMEAEINELVKTHPGYGSIVCRCEKVTEGEIIRNIHRTLGAKNLDALKRRTRLGMGRCQGGFCSCRAVEILSRELGIPMEQVTKSGGSSTLLVGRTK